jgi:electron transfer flavoprotein beta subunit
MKIAVCIKWVPDPEYPLRATADGLNLDSPGLTYMASPLDMVACEAAVRLKEAAGGTVSLFTAGPEAADAGLRSGLALGADDATRVNFTGGGLSGGTRTGRLLAAAIAREAPDVVICGTRSPDSGSGAVPATIAERLSMPLVTNVVSISGPGPVEIERRLEGGRRQTLRVQPPVVIAVEESLCDPRYPSVFARRKADRATITLRTAAELGVDLPDPAVTLVRLQGPRPLNARLVAPAPELPARERLAYILAGGPDQKRASNRLEGPVSAVIDQLMAFLTANGVVNRENGGHGS